ncbi:MAG: T9SS type A sorting domain-containing protein [Bacteroidota bacterium]
MAGPTIFSAAVGNLPVHRLSKALLFLCVMGASLWLGAPSGYAQGSVADFHFSPQVVFPDQVVDTQTYDLGFFLVNDENAADYQGGIVLWMSINGEAPEQLASFNPSFTIGPGDSIHLFVPAYRFYEHYFAGGGVTHDIIVWPSLAASAVTDTFTSQLDYLHTYTNASKAIRIDKGTNWFPDKLVDSTILPLSLTLVNLDTRYFYQPLSVAYEVDHTNQGWLVQDYYIYPAMEPGEIREIELPEFLFKEAMLAGGGINHDIIVWPSAFGIISDTLVHSFEFLDSSAFEIKSLSGLPTKVEAFDAYDLVAEIENKGKVVNQTVIECWGSIDGEEPILLASFSEKIEPYTSSTLSLTDFEVAAAFGKGGALSFYDRAHSVSLYFVESGRENWLNQFSFQVEQPDPQLVVEKIETEGRPVTVSVTWVVPLGTEAQYWVLERFDPARGIFIPIKTMEGDDSLEALEFLDVNPFPGVNIYRLVRVLPDGSQIVVAETSIEVTVTPDPVFKLYPNPSMGDLQIYLPHPVEGKLHFRLIDAQGRVVYRTKIPGRRTGTTQVHLPALSSGIYFYQLRSPDFQQDGKWVLIKGLH